MVEADMILAKQIGERVRLLRHQADPTMSQEKLAERAELTPVYVSEIEHGKKKISVAACARIARAFGIGLSEFFLGVGD